ncbi:MAG TPA: NAD(P)H-dependent oxidoreductase subunit E [Syntrophorhabdaceae bacterium]|nr:NAD(P)H-dependent oxidoreductase subunit E [Syntrophorhabdaceae bacterium]
MNITLEQLDTISLRYIDAMSKYSKIIKICCGTGCVSSGALKVYEELKRVLTDRGLIDEVLVKKTGCHGLCERGPIVVLGDEEILYQSVGKRNINEDITALLKTIGENEIVDRLLYQGEDKGKRYISPRDIPFYAGQKRIVLSLNGIIDPEDIEEYISKGGYRALYKALLMEPEEIIEWVEKSGLRGRGGGGFPTGTKWRSCRVAHGDIKYVVANGDEGDPGAFMDRSLMEGNPHSIIEGMIIGGYAIGSNQGFIYVRDEYPLAVNRLIGN